MYDNEDSVCGIIYNDVPYYFFKNLQGDVIAIVNKDAETVAKYSYDAWGVPTITSDTSEIGIATINPYRYRGYYYDNEIGLYYLQSRYYDPVVGRFVNADETILIILMLNSTELNLWCYSYNNVMNIIDPTGFLGKHWWNSVTWVSRILDAILIAVSLGKSHATWSVLKAFLKRTKIKFSIKLKERFLICLDGLLPVHCQELLILL